MTSYDYQRHHTDQRIAARYELSRRRRAYDRRLARHQQRQRVKLAAAYCACVAVALGPLTWALTSWYLHH